MLNRLNHTQLLRYAGLFTWAIVGIPLVFNAWYFPAVESGAEGGGVFQPNLRGAIFAYFCFGGLYWSITRALGARRARWFDIVQLVALTLSAIAVSHFTGTALASVLLMIIAGVVPWIVPLWLGVLWLILPPFALVPALMEGQGLQPLEAVFLAALYIGYSGFTFVTGLVAKQQAQAREDQRRLNAELRATRALLAESSRMSERVRISRELHDLLGHHLTALSLNLEVAGHLTEGKALEHVRQSHTLAKLLLTDVREAVSEMREDGAVDLIAAFRTLSEGVPALDIRMDLPETLKVEDPELGHALLRCAQEIITNAVRHAGAATLWLTLRREGENLCLQAHDDGRGADDLAPGNGLRGMRERVLERGGTLEIKTERDRGFAIDLRLPLNYLLKV